MDRLERLINLIAALLASERPLTAPLRGACPPGRAFASVARRRPVTFTYRGEERTVDPWRLAFRTGHWYLAGRDHGRDDERMFRLDRLESPITLDEEAGRFER